MAKIVKVKMIRVQNQGRIQNSYPAEYVSKKIEVVAYEGINEASKPYCIGVVKDGDLDSFTASKDINEITEIEALALGNVWRGSVKKITDVNKVLNILEKVCNSQDLTVDDENAIDPDHADAGVNMSSAFTGTLNKALGKMNG